MRNWVDEALNEFGLSPSEPVREFDNQAVLSPNNWLTFIVVIVVTATILFALAARYG